MNLKSMSAFFLFFMLLGFFATKTIADDGKLLRGQKWQRFSLEGKKVDFYIAPNGNDFWSGKLASPNTDQSDGPFATIERAQRAVLELKSNVYFPKEKPVEKRWIGSPHKYGSGRDILVLIRGGYYSLEKPIHFTAADGGERIETNLPSGAFEYHKLKDYYVTYAAYPGEIPVISGGKKIEHWIQNNGVWTAKITQTKIQNLVANGKTLTLARSPNVGYFIPPKFSQSAQELYFRKHELHQWPEMENNRVIMLLRWHTGINSFSRIDERNQIAYLRKPQPGIIIVPPRYYIENVKALQDAPGEWFFDKGSRQLSLIVPDTISNPNAANIIAPTLDQLVFIEGTTEKPIRNLRLYGLQFEGTIPGARAVHYEYAHNCELVDSEIRSMGGTGVFLARGCYHNRILNNKFEDIEQSAVIISGDAHPANWMDIIRQNIVSYNSIDNCGGTNIIASNTLGTIIAHNLITNTWGRYGISVGGWRNLEEAIDGGYRVEYNHLHHVQKDADDSGVIKTAGLTDDSVIRRNLIHDVKAGYFNDNVGFWFDNMSSGWLAEENIYYNLEQGEMKLCAANLVDNIYRNNFVIDPPENKPEDFILGEPEFDYTNMQIELSNKSFTNEINAGEIFEVKADVKNTGSTGILPIHLYLNRRIVQTKLFPVVHNNIRQIEFELCLHKPGEYQIAVGTVPFQTISVVGEKITVMFDKLHISGLITPEGKTIFVTAVLGNLENSDRTVTAKLYLNGKVHTSKSVRVAKMSSEKVQFQIQPKAGEYTVRIGNSPSKKLKIYSYRPIDLLRAEMKNYMSVTASPGKVEIHQKQNRYKIQAAGSDFFHAEDSYAAVYPVHKVKGNFVATVKVKGFGNRTHEWFRAGLFARNNMTKSFDTAPGSKGSVLMFTTPGRAGIQWDEFGNGCMHKADSQNLPEDISFPLWLKLERHENSFSGAISYDGETWINSKYTTDVPGLNNSIHLGLAAGSCDQIPYVVEFEDFQIIVEKE
ncbi:MAG: right-handed parallel beta-helix repeat-containing protein [Planctomycetota bacterium]